MKRKAIIGVMGPATITSKKTADDAFTLGKLIAEKGWILLTGGSADGVMDAVNRGAKEHSGLTVGIIKNKESKISKFIDIPIITDINDARNNVNVLSSDIVVACGTGLGTTSEIVLALKHGKTVILLNQSSEGLLFFKSLKEQNLHIVKTVQQAIDIIEKNLLTK
jgi:hypothetical protein